MTDGLPLELLVEAIGALMVLDEATVVVEVVLVLVPTLSEVVLMAAASTLEADADLGGLSSSLSLIVITSGTTFRGCVPCLEWAKGGVSWMVICEGLP